MHFANEGTYFKKYPPSNDRFCSQLADRLMSSTGTGYYFRLLKILAKPLCCRCYNKEVWQGCYIFSLDFA
jgi:hypothetical protein